MCVDGIHLKAIVTTSYIYKCVFTKRHILILMLNMKHLALDDV